MSVMVLCSVQMGRGRKTQTNARPVTRESAITPLVAFPCYDVMLPLKRCTDSAPAPPGAPGLSWGYWDWKGNTISDGHYEAPCSPQTFRSSLAAFPVRSSLIPIGGALCRLCALYGGVGRIVTAWQRHGDLAALDGSLLRRQRGRREPTGICDCSAARSQIPYYNRAALGFPETDPVGVCPSGCRCAVARDFAT